MKVKELVEKLSKLKDDTEVKIGYGCNRSDINFIYTEGNHIVLHPSLYDANPTEEWIRTLVNFKK